MIIMSVDLGKVRTGVAVCDKEEIIASPLPLIKETNREKLADKISLIFFERKAEKIVLGLPKNMDGSEGESAINVRAFATLLSEKINIDVDFFDERGTSVSAHNYLNLTDTRGKKRKEVVDSVSAVIILEDYIRKRKNSVTEE